MGGKRIDHSQVRGARIRGVKPSIISERLGCSERTVRRICQELPINIFTSELVGTDQEWLIWQNLKRGGKSYREIARLYCLSHEHIRQVLKEKEAEQLSTTPERYQVQRHFTNNDSTINEKDAA